MQKKKKRVKQQSGKDLISFQEFQNYQRNISCKDRHNKRLKWYGPNISRAIKKRWQEYIGDLYKKDLKDLDNNDSVLTHLEADIPESEVKYTLGSITINKANGGDEIPVEPFEILR